MNENIAENDFQAALQRGSKIDAIKHYREWKNIGLMESKRYVIDNWEELRQKAFSWDGK